MAPIQRIQRPRSHLVYVHYCIRENFSPLDTMSEASILTKFHLPRQQIQQLLDLVGPTFPEIQLLAALRFYAVGSFLEVVGDGYGLSNTSVWRCVHSVMDILLRHATDYIHMPSARQEMEVHQGFHAIAGIPQVIDLAFICRKGFTAIDVQVVVDHRGMFADVVAKWPGSTQDSFGWANSVVGQDAERFFSYIFFCFVNNCCPKIRKKCVFVEYHLI
ncbi:hypothetical protein ABG768_020637 [Culter alburnus]|uniref:DDE Tnp4 domain-containing protein n=1 Tax=Culter alburnus TaxID=194366 RepID=A0AAW2B393_CULAL